MKAQPIFGSVLRELRHKRGLSQEALADAAGVDRTFISMLERGVKQPSLSTLLALATPLGTSASKMVQAVESAIGEKARK